MCARYQHISMHGFEAFQKFWIYVHVKTETRSLCAALLCDCAQPGTCTAVACQTGLIVRQVMLDCPMSSFCIVYCRWQWNRLFAQCQNRTDSFQPHCSQQLAMSWALQCIRAEQYTSQQIAGRPSRCYGWREGASLQLDDSDW